MSTRTRLRTAIAGIPSTRRVIHRAPTSGLRADSKAQVISRNLLEQYPEAVGLSVPMGDVTYRVSNMDPFELYCLAAIARVRRPKTIFEFGTYDGATSLWLAKNVPDAQIFTLDLPPELLGEWEQSTLTEAPEGGQKVGSRFRGTPYEGRITQLFGDSRTFDYGEFLGEIDLVVVDADHSYECARSDTENALRLLSPRGTVVWDDFGWPGVRRAIEEASARHGFTAVNLVPSELVVYERSAASGRTT